MKLFIDHLSQPSRAVLAYCYYSGIKVDVVEVRIAKGENRTPEFLKVNPHGKVPALQDGSFSLGQSHSIVRYLSEKCKPQRDLFPSEPERRAKVNEYLDFHHGATRKCAAWLFNKYFAPRMGLKSNYDLPELQIEFNRVLKFIDSQYLKQKDYLTGSLSFADISAYCEIIQLSMVKYDLSKYPNLTKWMQRVGAVQEVRKAHLPFDKIRVRFQQTLQSKL